MTNVHQLKRPQVVDQKVIDEIRGMLDKAERGEVTAVVFAANLLDDGNFYRVSDYQDCWKMLGALAYAKDGVIKALGTVQL